MTIDKLHYISQPAQDGSHLTSIQKALDAGCKWIQLRVKNESPNDILQYAIAAKGLCQIYQAKLIINDYPEIAVASGADGLHLGIDDMPIAAARQIVGKDMIIGGTANTFEKLRQNVAEGADYIGLGPFRFTKTKEKLSPILGIEGYQHVRRKMLEEGLTIPVIAIGGILPEDIVAIMETGVHGIAISGAISYAGDPKQIVTSLNAKINSQC